MNNKLIATNGERYEEEGNFNPLFFEMLWLLHRMHVDKSDTYANETDVP